MQNTLKTYRIQYAGVLGQKYYTIKGYSLPKALKHFDKEKSIDKVIKVYINDKLVPDTYLFKLVDKMLWQKVKEAR